MRRLLSVGVAVPEQCYLAVASKIQVFLAELVESVAYVMFDCYKRCKCL